MVLQEWSGHGAAGAVRTWRCRTGQDSTAGVVRTEGQALAQVFFAAFQQLPRTLIKISHSHDERTVAVMFTQNKAVQKPQTEAAGVHRDQLVSVSTPKEPEITTAHASPRRRHRRRREAA